MKDLKVERLKFEVTGKVKFNLSTLINIVLGRSVNIIVDLENTTIKFKEDFLK